MCKTRSCLLLLVAFALGLVCHYWPSPVDAQQSRPAASQKGVGDLAERVKKARADLDAVETELLSVAKDAQAHPFDRRDAILLLARTRGDKAIAFLVANLSLEFPPPLVSHGSDLPMMLEPCRSLLIRLAHERDWRIIPAILKGVSSEWTDDELGSFASAIGHAAGKRQAVAIIEAELKDPENTPTKTKNLKALAAKMEK